MRGYAFIGEFTVLSADLLVYLSCSEENLGSTELLIPKAKTRGKCDWAH